MSQNTGFFSNYLEQWRLQKIVDLIPKTNLRLLDIGCGRASIIKKLSRIDYYTGIDLLPETIKENGEQYANYEFVCDDIFQVDLKDNFYNVVILSAFVEHLTYQDNLKLFKKLYMAMEKKGVIIGTTPHQRAEKIHQIGAKLRLFSREAANEHQCFFDQAMLDKLAQETGFAMIKYRTFQFGLNQVFVYEKV
jgi:2-polyprenyl-3-methyl-5-hydroxy-6-metoxy-1,4-benzoquinol methylase